MQSQETMLKRDLGDILDRYSISCLKKERINSEDSKKEYLAFNEMFQSIKKEYKQYDVEQWFEFLLHVNSSIWQLESGLKSGKEELANPIYLLDKRNSSALNNIGITTILIRDFNSLRVGFKNIINKIVGEGFQDKKQDHLSE